MSNRESKEESVAEMERKTTRELTDAERNSPLGHDFVVTDDFVSNLLDLLNVPDSPDSMLASDGEWAKISESGDRNATVYRLDKLITGKVFKVVVHKSSASPESLVRLLHDEHPARHPEWNDTYLDGGILESSEDGTANIQWWRYSTPAILANRDFVVAHRIVQRDGNYVIVERSIDRHDHPVPEGFVRCNLGFNVRVIQPLPNGGSRIFYMNQTDLGGMVPKAFTDLLNPKVSLKEMVEIAHIGERDTQTAAGKTESK